MQVPPFFLAEELIITLRYGRAGRLVNGIRRSLSPGKNELQHVTACQSTEMTVLIQCYSDTPKAQPTKISKGSGPRMAGGLWRSSKGRGHELWGQKRKAEHLKPTNAKSAKSDKAKWQTRESKRLCHCSELFWWAAGVAFCGVSSPERPESFCAVLHSRGACPTWLQMHHAKIVAWSLAYCVFHQTRDQVRETNENFAGIANSFRTIAHFGTNDHGELLLWISKRLHGNLVQFHLGVAGQAHAVETFGENEANGEIWWVLTSTMGQQVTKALQQSPALVSGHGHVLSPNQKRLLLLFQDVSRVRLAALLLKQFAECRSLPQGRTRCATRSSLWFCAVLGYLAFHWRSPAKRCEYTVKRGTDSYKGSGQHAKHQHLFMQTGQKI